VTPPCAAFEIKIPNASTDVGTFNGSYIRTTSVAGIVSVAKVGEAYHRQSAIGMRLKSELIS
jgi:hypothetical protein